jgi:hypothetical protein
MEKNSTTDEMKTMVSCLNKLVSDGFTEDFQVNENGFYSIQRDKYYKPEDIHIVNYYRFEGASDPSDNSILYAIETNDGYKGSLVDAYGPDSDPLVHKFLKQVEDITKKPVNNPVG